MPDPTPRQLAILALLWREQSTGRPVPTYREAAEAIGLRSHSTAHHHMEALVSAGLIARDPRPRAERSLTLTDAGHLALGRRTRFPVRGTVG